MCGQYRVIVNSSVFRRNFQYDLEFRNFEPGKPGKHLEFDNGNRVATLLEGWLGAVVGPDSMIIALLKLLFIYFCANFSVGGGN